MKVIRYYEEEGPGVLKLEEQPEPEPATGQVKLRIVAAGVEGCRTRSDPCRLHEDGRPTEVSAQNGGVGVDLALEVTGGRFVHVTLDATRAGRRVANYGNVTDTDAPVYPRALLSRNLTLTGYNGAGQSTMGYGRTNGES